MYLHIGNKSSVRKKRVIGIFDLDTATVSPVTRRYISQNERAGRVEYTDSDLPRSFILVEEKDGFSVKLSRISTLGLKARAEGEEILYNPVD
ncbi:MAG: DUF370 domain-containing protein [Clostridia bacterium]|nr:DUF370 domain-containing protein [Clostridia bacterium]